MSLVHSLARLPISIPFWFYYVWIWQMGWNWLAAPGFNLPAWSYGQAWIFYALVRMPLVGIGALVISRTKDEQTETEKWVTVFIWPVVYSFGLFQFWIIRFFVIG